MHDPRNFSLAALAMLACLVMPGCTSGTPHFKAKGKIVDGEKPVAADPNSSILLTFVPSQIDPEKSFNTYTARITDATGEFTVVGNDNAGLPAGSYRVKVRTMSPQPSQLSTLLNRKFGSDTSPLLVTVVDEATPLVIDIAPHKSK